MVKLKRSKILLLLIAVCLVAVIANTTLAYFTDSQQSEGVFTAGGVYIELSEAATKVGDGGNLVEDTESARIVGAALDAATVHDYGRVYPGMTIHKDPTIKNVGDDAAWIAAKIILRDGVGDIHSLYGIDGSDDLNIYDLLSGGLLTESCHVGLWNGIEDVAYNDHFAMVQKSSHQAGVYEFYIFVSAALAKDESVELFDTLTFHPMFGNEQMKEFKEFSITVQAFAVQTFGFDSCFDAMIGAFGAEHFSAVVPTP